MHKNRRIDALTLRIILAAVLFASTYPISLAQNTQRIDPAIAKLGNNFVSRTAKVNGTTLHYVRGGSGPALILLHGFPQDWYEYRHIMPSLAKKFTVIVPDLRGIGGSTPTPSGYDAANLAEDIFELTQQLKLENVYLVGHDVGGIVTYAFLRLYPKTLRGVMILEVPIPGLDPWEEIKKHPGTWHMAFHQRPGLAEKLIAGREAIYFRDFFNRSTLNQKSITDEDVDHYAKAYAGPGQFRAAMEMYRAFPASEKLNASQKTAINVSIVLVGGDKSFGPVLPKLAGSMKAHGCSNVHVEIISNSAHYILEEQPQGVTTLIEKYSP